jgi:hypothetical protein
LAGRWARQPWVAGEGLACSRVRGRRLAAALRPLQRAGRCPGVAAPGSQPRGFLSFHSQRHASTSSLAPQRELELRKTHAQLTASLEELEAQAANAVMVRHRLRLRAPAARLSCSGAWRPHAGAKACTAQLPHQHRPRPCTPSPPPCPLVPPRPQEVTAARANAVDACNEIMDFGRRACHEIARVRAWGGSLKAVPAWPCLRHHAELPSARGLLQPGVGADSTLTRPCALPFRPLLPSAGPRGVYHPRPAVGGAARRSAGRGCRRAAGAPLGPARPCLPARAHAADHLPRLPPTPTLTLHTHTPTPAVHRTASAPRQSWPR